ncbi:PREDICTED: dynein heavy chain 14, axonemal [Calidris pugnax]|uniref:dynein heavy chain 14, axonemal n=1 Tax=Calidris pugnax TaxID=198806 RepID=UPI00071E3B1A|nr:PREDICTED: dynein heavy chain 14, axonemal [Calidris pugnax]
MDERNKALKEKLISRLRFEPERTEVLLTVKGRDIACDPADSSEKDNSELSSSLEKKYSSLRTAVYRGRTERKHKATIKEEGVCFGNVLSRIHKEGREESGFQPSSVSEQETVKLKRSITKPVSLTSANENLKKTLPTASACKGVQHDFDMSPPSPVYVADDVSKIEMQKAILEPSSHKKTCEQPKVERSSKKSLRGKVRTYDKTKPIDDDVITHILRLRGKLGWQTTLPSCEQLAGETDVSRLQEFTLTRPLLLKDTGEYIYCLQRNRNNFKVPYNPYDLQAVSTNTAMQNEVYWTVTASFVSKFSADRNLGEMETTPVPQWLYERQMYYKLLSFNLFSNFRMKKYFLVWKINARKSKTLKTKSV